MCFGLDIVLALYLVEGKESFLRIKGTVIYSMLINLLKTKRKLLYLKTHFLPRSKQFSCRLEKPI